MIRSHDTTSSSAGSFGGSPALPADKVTTISTSVLLVARTSLSNRAASELTRLLLATKTRLAATWSEARQLTAPPIETDALLPAHPGTIAFLPGAQPDLLDQSTNLFLLASMLTGFVGWVAAALNGLRNRRKGNEVRCHIRRLPLLLAQANAAGPEQLGNIENEVARLSEWLLQKFMANEISPSDFDSAEARVTQITALIRMKRRCASLDQLERFLDQWRSSTAAVAAG